MGLPVISVVIPLYQAEAWIEEAIASVVGLSLLPTVVIVVDDGSSDLCSQLVAVIDRQSPIPTRLLSQINMGQAAARNAGLKVARGDLVAFLDADDVWLPDKLERQCQLLTAARASAVTCAYSLLDQDRLKSRAFHFDWTDSSVRAWTLAYGVGPALMSTLVIQRELALQLGGFREDMSVFTDLNFSLRLRQRSVVVGLPEILMHYRQHSHQIHRNSESLVAEAQFFGEQTLVEKDKKILVRNITILNSMRGFQVRASLWSKVSIIMRCAPKAWAIAIFSHNRRLYRRLQSIEVQTGPRAGGDC